MTTKISTEIHSAGGVIVNGNVNTSGDFVGRDKHVYLSGEVACDVNGLRNPYIGLRSFTYDDRELFVGRETELADALTMLTRPDQSQTLLFVTGASGSGKSSFVQAALIPSLETYYQKRRLSVQHSVFHPTMRPLAMLNDALLQLGVESMDRLANAGKKQVNLLILDQFEELFTQSDPQERNSLFQWLIDLPKFDEARTHVIATIRSDYLNELAEVALLWMKAKDAIVLRAMSIESLKATIQRPLQVCYPDGEKRFEPALVDRLAQDSANDPTFLPLLQITLTEIWRKGKLTLASYHNLTDALKQRADQVIGFKDYNASTPDKRRSVAEQTILLNIFLDLTKVSLDDNLQHDIRVGRPVEALCGFTDDGVTVAQRQSLMNELVEARLLSVADESGVETANIVHESLIRNWDRLQKVIAEKRQILQQRGRFEQQLRDWLGNQRSDEYLLHGIHLAEAHKLADQADVVFRHNHEANEFFQRSCTEADSELKLKVAHAEARANAERRAVNRTRLLLLASVVLVAILGVPVVYRAGLRYQAIRLGPVIWIPASQVMLGKTGGETEDGFFHFLQPQMYHLSGFAMDQYEVTNQRYNLCIQAGVCSRPITYSTSYESSEQKEFPVVDVTAYQASEFCQWLGRSLPSDTHWERAARSLDGRNWPWGNQPTPAETIADYANLNSNAVTKVGTFSKGNSVEGIVDLAGNVWEMTRSAYALKDPNEDPPADLPISISLRGGGANTTASAMEDTIAYRADGSPTWHDSYIGFRCVVE
jgi:formylglycine-generating enzyme required for sulfatase activity